MEPDSQQVPASVHHSEPDESNSPPHIRLFKVLFHIILPATRRSSKKFLLLC